MRRESRALMRWKNVERTSKETETQTDRRTDEDERA